MSESLRETDMRPTRHAVVLKGVEAFIREYFDLNPISQLGLIVTKSKKATLVTDMGGNPSAHIDALRAHSVTAVAGEPSLQNALRVAASSLASLPKYGAREILVIFSSLTTCDPENVLTTIQDVADAGITTSVIGFGASVRVLSYLAERTGGRYSVPMHAAHFRSTLLSHATPTPVKEGSRSVGTALVRMGFPGIESAATVESAAASSSAASTSSLCACHQYLTDAGYVCPHCGSKMCEIPSDCATCGLTLVAPPHLARSYHHLFPVPPFSPPSDEEVADLPGLCFACAAVIPRPVDSEPAAFRVCASCTQRFCFACDNFIHQALHNCPGCQMPGASVPLPKPVYPEAP